MYLICHAEYKACLYSLSSVAFRYKFKAMGKQKDL